MNEAQQAWTELYLDFRINHDQILRDEMLRYRREAALERQIAALQRKVEAYTMRVNGVIRIINDGAEKWEHTFDEETESCKYCGYEWPCQYETIRRALLGLDDENIIACSVPSDRIEIDA